MDEEENDPEIQTTITKGHSGHSQILHVRQDSLNELDQLFNVALDPNKKAKSLPMKYRKLPKSFFQQPDRPRHGPMHAHSRSMGGLVSTPVVDHSRSSSTDSSASHQSNLNLSSNNPQQQSPAQMNNVLGPRSGNFTPGPMQHSPFSNTPSHMGLQLPQIAHSRSKSSPASLQMVNANMQMKIQQPTNQIEIPPDMPLPPGWEFAKTQDGQTYFMNHTNRTTTWVDPRIAIIKEQQERANASNMQAVNHQQSQMHINSVQQQAEQIVVQQPLPSGWEQATTPQGEIYFINHETRTTSWLDPRLQNMNLGGQSQMNAQIQQQLHKMNQLDISSPAAQGSHQQRAASGSQMLYSKLAKEKEMIMKMRQQQMLKQTGMDPFLGSNSCHEREPSRDSGVSGMGNSFNLPRNSNEYLGNVEEMDTDGGNHNQQEMNQQQSCMATSQQGRQQHAQRGNAHQQQAQHFPDFLDSLPASSVDFTNEGNHQQSNTLDSEELVPSISETLSPDFMQDVESMLNPVVKSENMDSMTWL